MQPELIAFAAALLLATGLLVVSVAVTVAALHPIKPPPLEPAAVGPAHPLPTPMR